MRVMVPSVAFAAVVSLSGGAVPAHAANGGGPYLSLHGGPTYLQGEDVDLPGGGRIEPDYEFGYLVGGAVGYAFGPFRVEGELAFQHNGIDDGDSGGLAIAVDDLGGDAMILSFLINGYYEVDIDYPLKPFVGVGAGVARVALQDVDATVTVAGVPTSARLIDDEDTVPAAQALAGLSFDLNEHWTTAFSYRFFAAFGAEFEAAAPLAGTAEADFFSHAFRFEARYRF